MLSITVYTSLDIGIEEVEVKAKELALLLSYYTGKKTRLTLIILPSSSPEVKTPAVLVNETLFDTLDASEIVSRMILAQSSFSSYTPNYLHAISTA